MFEVFAPNEWQNGSLKLNSRLFSLKRINAHFYKKIKTRLLIKKRIAAKVPDLRYFYNFCIVRMY